MKPRLIATFSFFIILLSFLGGCASTGGDGPSWSASGPQMLIPGATREDLRGIAMGVARSKSWTIVGSSNDKVVMQRPPDPNSQMARSLGADSSAIPPVIEVTALFIELSNGVNVSLHAELISQPPGAKQPKRTDVTESFRAELTRSLESLRSKWQQNHQRVAQAMPPIMSKSERVAQGGPEDPHTPIQAWSDSTSESGTLVPTRFDDSVAREPIASPTPPDPPQPAVAESPPAPTSAAAGPRPAPVLDGSRTASTSPPTAPTPPPQPETTSILPPPPPTPVESDNDMLTLSQASGTGTWAYYAEQYARLRGCNLTEQGAILIETRSDGEVHRVPCIGSDSFLLKCSDGVCRGLQ